VWHAQLPGISFVSGDFGMKIEENRAKQLQVLNVTSK
jgi:hypothetical protein